MDERIQNPGPKAEFAIGRDAFSSSSRTETQRFETASITEDPRRLTPKPPTHAARYQLALHIHSDDRKRPSRSKYFPVGQNGSTATGVANDCFIRVLIMCHLVSLKVFVICPE